MSTYKIEWSLQAQLDVEQLSTFLHNYNKEIVKIDRNVKGLKYMPRAHKTLISHKDPARRIQKNSLRQLHYYL